MQETKLSRIPIRFGYLIGIPITKGMDDMIKTVDDCLKRLETLLGR